MVVRLLNIKVKLICTNSLNDAGRKWSADDKRWLSPLPTDELTLNPNLEQNPGWK